MHHIAAPLLVACADAPPAAVAFANVVFPNPDSGITFSDGGAPTLSDQPNVSVTTRTGPRP